MRWIIGARSIESRIRIFNIALTGGGGSEGSDRSWCPLHRRRGSIRESEVMERDKREYLITQNRERERLYAFPSSDPTTHLAGCRYENLLTRCSCNSLLGRCRREPGSVWCEHEFNLHATC